MGWAGGSQLMNVIIAQVSKYVPSAGLRVRIYQPIVDAFNAQDWDTHAECIGTDAAFDEVMREVDPEIFDGEDEDEDEEDGDLEHEIDDVDDEDDFDDDEEDLDIKHETDEDDDDDEEED